MKVKSTFLSGHRQRYRRRLGRRDAPAEACPACSRIASATLAGIGPQPHAFACATCQRIRSSIFEAILDTVKEALLARVELSEEAARESEVRTAHLMKLLDLIH